MNEQDKQLLLKDISARLPYGVKAQFDYENIGKSNYEVHTIKLCFSEGDLNILVYGDGSMGFLIENIKMYLRPMSSITDDEKKELNNILEFQYCSDDSCMCESTDWLNAHHFDYRGLIEMGLALEAPEGMYEIK